MSLNSEWLNAMQSIHTVEHFSAIKRNKALTQATTGTDTLYRVKEAFIKDHMLHDPIYMKWRLVASQGEEDRDC